MSVCLHIEQLVLDGLPLEAAHEPVLRAALEAELVRLLTKRAPGAGWRDAGAVDALRGPTLQLSPVVTPATLGREVGAAIYTSLQP